MKNLKRYFIACDKFWSEFPHSKDLGIYHLQKKVFSIILLEMQKDLKEQDKLPVPKLICIKSCGKSQKEIFGVDFYDLEKIATYEFIPLTNEFIKRYYQ